MLILKIHLFGKQDLLGIEPGPPAFGTQSLSTGPPGTSHTIKPLDPVFPLLLLTGPGASLCAQWYPGVALFWGPMSITIF